MYKSKSVHNLTFSRNLDPLYPKPKTSNPRRRHKSLPYGISEYEIDASAAASVKYPGLCSRSVYKRNNLDLKPYTSKQNYSSFGFGLASGDTHQPSSPYSSRILNSRNIIGESLATDDIKYKRYRSGKTRARQNRELLNSYASLGSYLQESQTGQQKYSNGSSMKNSLVIPRKFGSYDNFSFSSSLPSSYCRKYLESDYKPAAASSARSEFYSSYSSYEPWGIVSSSFDPKASYISDMESRDFGSHVDMIQSLQLRSSLVEPPSDIEPPLDYTNKPFNPNLMLKSDLDLSLNPMIGKEPQNTRSSIATPGSARVSFLSPCIERSIQLTEPFSSYTSSPTSPFSEPFPNPHQFSFEEDKSPPPPPPQPINNKFDTFPVLDCSFPAQTVADPIPLPINLEALALDSLHEPCISSSIETCLASNVYQNQPAHSTSLPSKTEQFTNSSGPQLKNSIHLSNITMNSNIKEDETLKLLKKYYLEALLAQQMPSERDNITSGSQDNDNIMDYKKMYEECHRENRQLSYDIHGVKLQLQKVKHQLELAAQASALNPVSDDLKYDKNKMDKKLIEIRNELKLFTLSGNVTSQQLERLGKEIEELKFENRSLSQNVMTLMPADHLELEQTRDSSSI